LEKGSDRGDTAMVRKGPQSTGGATQPGVYNGFAKTP